MKIIFTIVIVTIWVERDVNVLKDFWDVLTVFEKFNVWKTFQKLGETVTEKITKKQEPLTPNTHKNQTRTPHHQTYTTPPDTTQTTRHIQTTHHSHKPHRRTTTTHTHPDHTNPTHLHKPQITETIIIIITNVTVVTCATFQDSCNCNFFNV